MAKQKLVIAGLIVVVVLSLTVNVAQWNTNLGTSQQNLYSEIKQQMVSQLTHTQNNINMELAELDRALMAATQEVSTTGLTGGQADATLSGLVANNSLIVNAAISNSQDIIVAVQPSSYSGIIGEDLSRQEQFSRLHQTKMPAMSNMIPLVEGFPGVVMVAPVFSADQKLIGAVSIVVMPSALINQSIASDATYSMWAIQSNGTLIYDPDPAQQGKNLLTDPIYTEYPEVQAFAGQVAAQQSGYGTYQYYIKNLDQNQNRVVAKEAYWITVGVYGTEWRLVIWHAINP